MSRRVEKEYEVALRARTLATDTECADGEVERSENVRWLAEAQETADEAIREEEEKKGVQTEQYVVRRSSVVATLPAGAEVLALHSPEGASPRTNVIILTDDREIVVYGTTEVTATGATALEGPAVTVGMVPLESYGAFVKGACFGGIVTLLFEKRMCWLVAGPDGGYGLRRSLPTSPEVTFTSSPVLFPPYVTTEGGEAAIDVKVAVGGADAGLTQEVLSGWIDGGEGGRVSEPVKESVMTAVEERVTEYLEAVRNAGLTTNVLAGVAGWSGHLPCGKQTIGAYTQPTLRIGSWGYASGVLELKLHLSATPREVWARFSIPADHTVWSDIFPRLAMYLAETEDWWGDRVRVNGLTSVTVGGERKRGFSLRSFTAVEMSEKVSALRQYYKCGEYGATAEASGVMKLSLSEMRNREGGYVPDYGERNMPLPGNVISTDEGFVAVSGSVVMRQASDCPVVYPHRLEVGDRGIDGLVAGCIRRSAGKSGLTPLYAFSGDGIRLLGSDGAGGYGVLQLLSHDNVGIGTTEAACEMGSGAAVLTKRGLLSVAGTVVKRLTEKEAPEGSEEVCGMFYDGRSDGVWMMTRGRKLLLWDMRQDVWSVSELPVFGMMVHLGECFVTDNLNRLVVYGGARVVRELHGEKVVTHRVVGGGEEYGSLILTRPMKFGGAWKQKRVNWIRFLEEAAGWELEQSGDAREWRLAASGNGRWSGRLWLGAARYWRLRLRMSDEGAADRLRRVVFGVTTDSTFACES